MSKVDVEAGLRLRDAAEGKSWMSKDYSQWAKWAVANAEKMLDSLSAVLVAVTEHRNQKLDDLCWEDDNCLYVACGLEPRDPVTCDKEKMLANCSRYIDARCKPDSKWKSYQELEQELQVVKKVADAAAKAHLSMARWQRTASSPYSSEAANRHDQCSKAHDELNAAVEEYIKLNRLTLDG